MGREIASSNHATRLNRLLLHIQHSVIRKIRLFTPCQFGLHAQNNRQISTAHTTHTETIAGSPPHEARRSLRARNTGGCHVLLLTGSLGGRAVVLSSKFALISPIFPCDSKTTIPRHIIETKCGTRFPIIVGKSVCMHLKNRSFRRSLRTYVLLGPTLT